MVESIPTNLFRADNGNTAVKQTNYLLCEFCGPFTSIQATKAQTDPIVSKIEEQLGSSGHHHLIWISQSYPMLSRPVRISKVSATHAIKSVE